MSPAASRTGPGPSRTGHGSSRAATDELLTALRKGRCRPAAWARFLFSSARRSAGQAAARPRALTEVTVLHAALALAAGRPGRRWLAASWAMAATHLGMLEDQASLGPANLVTLLRANLPALSGAAGIGGLDGLVRWLPALALASDLADGRIARSSGTVTAFGQHADSLADASFWTWFALRHEPSRRVRVLALAAWAVPVLAVTAASVSRGRMTDPPRPAVLRPAAAMQAVIAVRAAAAARRPASRVPPDVGACRRTRHRPGGHVGGQYLSAHHVGSLIADVLGCPGRECAFADSHAADRCAAHVSWCFAVRLAAAGSDRICGRRHGEVRFPGVAQSRRGAGRRSGCDELWVLTTGRSWRPRCRTWRWCTRWRGAPPGMARIRRTWCRKPTCGPMPRSVPGGAGARGRGWPRSA